ncbi:hypothetical protein E2C01_090835 [Portunus trituberculatus]|uniref:Uncharacterized protein n=1 Tax=Portunus trituberculatus TaxID=210409 RepID=A0A5B7JRA3_PORTR|nr:hypothetical protein [Portunus trituberculatus]
MSLQAHGFETWPGLSVGRASLLGVTVS